MDAFDFQQLNIHHYEFEAKSLHNIRDGLFYCNIPAGTISSK